MFFNIRALLGCAALALCTLTACAHDSQQLTVFAAASTRVINTELEQHSTSPLSIHNAGSSTLVQQLREGAPADVLITANRRTMQQALADKLVEAPRTVATNSMVLVVPRGNPAGIRGIDDLDRAVVVRCDSQVPCGEVTEALAKANNVTIKAASLEQSVSDVLGKVASGEADAGVVYRTDADAAGDAVEVIPIPHAEEYPNEILAAVVNNSPHREQAEQLCAHLASTDFDAVWADHGFQPAP